MVSNRNHARLYYMAAIVWCCRLVKKILKKTGIIKNNLKTVIINNKNKHILPKKYLSVYIFTKFGAKNTSGFCIDLSEYFVICCKNIRRNQNSWEWVLLFYGKDSITLDILTIWYSSFWWPAKTVVFRRWRAINIFGRIKFKFYINSRFCIFQNTRFIY